VLVGGVQRRLGLSQQGFGVSLDLLDLAIGGVLLALQRQFLHLSLVGLFLLQGGQLRIQLVDLGRVLTFRLQQIQATLVPLVLAGVAELEQGLDAALLVPLQLQRPFGVEDFVVDVLHEPLNRFDFQLVRSPLLIDKHLLLELRQFDIQQGVGEQCLVLRDLVVVLGLGLDLHGPRGLRVQNLTIQAFPVLRRVELDQQIAFLDRRPVGHDE